MGGRGCVGTRPGGGGEAARLLGSPPTGGGDGLGGETPAASLDTWPPPGLDETKVWVVLTSLRVVGMVGFRN